MRVKTKEDDNGKTKREREMKIKVTHSTVYTYCMQY